MYDILVIGSGPAGYVAAIRAGQLGLKVGCIEEGPVGGTCLNIGCIPSKSLLDSSLKHYQLNNDYSEHGIRVENVSIDLEKMMSRKNVVIDQLTQGVSALLKTNKVDLIKGRATTIKKNSIDYIVCFGGYISLPVGLAAWICRKPLFLHEQNSILGTSNRILQKFAEILFLGFSINHHAFQNTMLVGNPIKNFNKNSIPNTKKNTLRILSKR